MKIGFVFDDSLDRDDGVQQYIKTLGTWLSGASHDVKYLVGETHRAGSFQPSVISLSKNIGVKANKNRLSIPLPASSVRIRAVLKEENFDVLHVQAPFNPFLAGKVINNAPPGTGIVATFHIVGSSRFEQIGLRLLSFLQNKSIIRIDDYLAVSPAASQESSKYFPTMPHISPNVVDTKRFFSMNNKNENNKTILYLGRLVERKGVGHLIEALNLTNDRSLKLMIAGDGPLKVALQARVEELNMQEQVVFLGYISEEKKPEIIKKADLAVFPATSGESFGIVLIEAMSCGVLTLGGNNPGYATVLNGPSEMLVNPLDHEEFAQRLKSLIYDEELRSSLATWQKDRVQDFDVERVGPQLLNHYRSAQQHSISLSK